MQRPTTTTPPEPTWVEVRSPTTKRLLFRYDPHSHTVEIKPKHGQAERIRLAEVQPKKA